MLGFKKSDIWDSEESESALYLKGASKIFNPKLLDKVEGLECVCMFPGLHAGDWFVEVK